MLTYDSSEKRCAHSVSLAADLAVVGGGMAGLCCAVTAARAGARVVLVQDRPVLGGNASSEIRLWVLGATSHMGNNNRWAREGGVVDEILVENMYRNPEGNPVIFDTILLEKVVREPNVKLLLNTAVHDLDMGDEGRIQALRAFCSQNSTQYEVTAPLFCDASGDGIVGFLSGAAFRIGAESQIEFGEPLAPPAPKHELLGHSIYFYTRDTGRPVKFVAPSFALDDIKKIPRYRSFNAKEHGCQLWWIEYGGGLDTVHDTEQIKWELWKVVYGVWNHIKNSGEFPEAETLTLEWVGLIPGKRESRRFEGDYMLIQQDIVQQREHYDAISYGGWAIDLHPVDGIYSAEAPCTQWHSKGVYQIPYRAMYSRNVSNLFLAGRIISTSHIAFGSTRVMATCAHNGQAVGMAAAMCAQEGLLPRDLAVPPQIGKLQRNLMRVGHYVPGIRLEDNEDLVHQASITSSSRLHLQSLRADGEVISLAQSRAMVLPVKPGRMPAVSFFVAPSEDTELVVELRSSSRCGSFTPDVLLERVSVPVSVAADFQSSEFAGRTVGHNGGTSLAEGEFGTSRQGTMLRTTAIREPAKRPPTRIQPVAVQFNSQITSQQYVFVCLAANPRLSVQTTSQRVTGLASLVHRANGRVARAIVQDPPPDIGIDRFEFWTPERRPHDRWLAFELDAALDVFGPHNLANGLARPTTQPNAWVAAFDDPQPRVEFRWEQAQSIERIEISFDTDFDHAMENVLMGHAEQVMPYCIRDYRIRGSGGVLLLETTANYQTRNSVRFTPPIRTNALEIEVDASNSRIPASIYEVRCYG